MLKLGGKRGRFCKGTRRTYAIAPHIPCGVVTPELLRKMADVAEKYQAKALKITGATRIAIVGLKEEDIDDVWKELSMAPGAAVGLCVRSIRACPGKTFCKLGLQGRPRDGHETGRNLSRKNPSEQIQNRRVRLQARLRRELGPRSGYDGSQGRLVDFHRRQRGRDTANRQGTGQRLGRRGGLGGGRKGDRSL